MTTEKNDATLDLINQLDSMLSRDTSQYTLDKAKELAEAGKRYQVSQMAGERQARKAAETDRKAA